MIISHKYKFIFIKTRKTAGSSIERFLIDYLGPDDICTGSLIENTKSLNIDYIDGHKDWKFIKENYPKEFKNYYKFAVERNPWDKVISYYYYSKNKKPKRTKNGVLEFISKFSKNVDDWSLYSDGEKIVVDKIFKFEDLHNDFKRSIIPYNDELLKIKLKSSFRGTVDYKDLYDEESILLIRKKFKNVIKLFNYEF